MQDEMDLSRSDGCLRVLVVEDEFLIAMDVEQMLIEGGHKVLGAAGTVDEALRFLDDQRPDVAVLDMNLCGQLVIPVAERLRSLGIPFVIASAYRTLEFDGAEVLAGAENIGKPCAGRLLLQALDRAARPR